MNKGSNTSTYTTLPRPQITLQLTTLPTPQITLLTTPPITQITPSTYTTIPTPQTTLLTTMWSTLSPPPPAATHQHSPRSRPVRDTQRERPGAAWASSIYADPPASRSPQSQLPYRPPTKSTYHLYTQIPTTLLPLLLLTIF